MKKASKVTDVAEKANAPFPTRLRALMDREQMKQADIAAMLNVTRQSANQYCLGLSSPDAEKLCKIAVHFNVTTDYLLGLSDVSSTDESTAAACKITGLSEKSILALSDKDFTLEYNLLFENGNWFNFISKFEEYISDIVNETTSSEMLQISKFELTHQLWSVLEKLDHEAISVLYKQRAAEKSMFFEQINKDIEVSQIMKLYEQFCKDYSQSISVSEYLQMAINKLTQ